MAFHDELKIVIHQYIRHTYRITAAFPHHELYGIVSQFRRSAVSVMLNYIEGFGRRKGEDCKVYNNYIEISYASLKEIKYLLFLSYDLGYIGKETYTEGMNLADRIGAMLWSITK